MWSSIWSWFIISVCLIDITKTEDVENKRVMIITVVMSWKNEKLSWTCVMVVSF